MIRHVRGSAIVEFALAFPVVIALVLPAVQILRAALLEARLEVLAFRVARRLVATATPPASLSGSAADWVHEVWPEATAVAGARNLMGLSSPSPRRPRNVEIIDVDLSADGPRLLPGFPVPLRAHAREFRWGAS